MTTFRFHRGGLAESMETCVEIKDGADLLELKGIKDLVNPNKEVCQEYYAYDERVSWESYIIYQKDEVVFGFSNGKITGIKETERPS